MLKNVIQFFGSSHDEENKKQKQKNLDKITTDLD